jgi:3-methyladenine DNA glycosylase AlkD
MKAMTASEIRARLQKIADRQRAQELQRFFKTGPGQYAEGDIFLGIRVPDLRRLAAEYQSITTGEALKLLRSAFHEERSLALMILIRAYRKGDEAAKKKIYESYLENTRFINNWDLVDVSAPHIVGSFLMNKSRRPLYRLARSEQMWERRIAVISTLYFIRQGDFSDSLKISSILISDKEDLIHKAVGWMLREVGNRHLPTEEIFLREHYRVMPRTMLRYAIEKFPEPQRQAYLRGKVN